jgi:2-amino-4-hydroxy-6-hydroxymethyldihydropteridine diphosphokinase
MTRAFIGLGSNVDDRLQYLQRAVKRLGDTVGVRVTGVSAVYETEPVGPADQPWFLNAVAALDTSLPPLSLLDQTQAIERALGRETTYRWGPRTIVMIPLLELDPGLKLPDGTAVSTRLSNLTPPQQVRFFAPPATLTS